MNKFSGQPIPFLLGLAALSVLGNAISAQAEPPDDFYLSAAQSPDPGQTEAVSPSDLQLHGETSVAIAARVQPKIPQNLGQRAVVAPTPRVQPPAPTSRRSIDERLLGAAAALEPTKAANPLVAQTPTLPATPQEAIVAVSENNAKNVPIPGTVATSADALFSSPTLPQEQTREDLAQTTLAQTRRSRRNRIADEPYSYVGIGGNIGITDDDDANDGRETPIGEGAFVINGKIGIGRSLSIRPAVVVNDDVAFLIPLTYDFRIPTQDDLGISPFIPFAGGGVVLTTTEENHIGFLLSGGVDYRISPQWTANGSLNVGFLSETTDIGIILGIGYTFPGFSF